MNKTKNEFLQLPMHSLFSYCHAERSRSMIYYNASLDSARDDTLYE